MAYRGRCYRGTSQTAPLRQATRVDLGASDGRVHADAGIDKTSHDGDVAHRLVFNSPAGERPVLRISAPTRAATSRPIRARGRAGRSRSSRAATRRARRPRGPRRGAGGGRRRTSPRKASATTARAMRSPCPAVEVVGGAADLGEGDVVGSEPAEPDLRVPDVAARDPLPWSSTRRSRRASGAGRRATSSSLTQGLGGHSDLLGVASRDGDLADHLAWPHGAAPAPVPGLLAAAAVIADARHPRHQQTPRLACDALEAPGYCGSCTGSPHRPRRRKAPDDLFGSVLASSAVRDGGKGAARGAAASSGARRRWAARGRAEWRRSTTTPEPAPRPPVDRARGPGRSYWISCSAMQRSNDDAAFFDGPPFCESPPAPSSNPAPIVVGASGKRVASGVRHWHQASTAFASASGYCVPAYCVSLPPTTRTIADSVENAFASDNYRRTDSAARLEPH